MIKHTRRKRRTVRRTRKHRGGINYGTSGNNELNQMRRNYYREQARMYGFRNNRHTSNNNWENNNSINSNNLNNNNNNNNMFNIPNNLNSLPTIEVNEDAQNAIMFNDINFKRPIFNFNDESKHGRYYQNSLTLTNLKKTGINPFTKKKINKATWMMPKKK